MSDQPATVAPTLDEALANVSRLLYAAEIETNLATMQRLDELACSWLSVARLLIDREHA